MDEEESIYSNIFEEEEDENSDEKAMRQFLEELKKYRQKFKKKSKEMQPKSIKSGKNAESSEGKKKKRKRRKLFDPHPPPKINPKDEENNDSPKKILTRKEYNSLMKRLTKSNKDQNSKKKNHDSPKKNENQQNIPKIFTDLYDKSLQAKIKRDEMIVAKNKSEEEDLKIRPKQEAWRQTKVYAYNRMAQYVKNTFGNNKICYEKKLLDILYKLGLVEYKVPKCLPEFSDPYKNSFDGEEEEEYTKEQKEQVDQPNEDENQNFTATFEDGKAIRADKLLRILQKLDLIKISKEPAPKPEFTEESSEIQREEIEEEEMDNNIGKRPFYEISNLIKFYLEVARDQISTKFHQIVKEKLLIAMANAKKQQKPKNTQNMQFTTALSLTRETLERLVTPKRQKSPEEIKATNQKENEEYQPIKLSEESKKILDESKRKGDDGELLCTLPIDQREAQLIKIKNEKIKQMKQEFQYQLVQGRVLSNPMPIYDIDTRKMVEKYKEEKMNRVEELPTYRPNITKYEDFIKKQEELNSSEVKIPKGWDKDITRHRKAYDDFIHLKRLKNEGIDYIMECRLNSKAQLKETANQNADSNANKNQNAQKSTDENKNIFEQKESSSPTKKTKNKKSKKDDNEDRVRFTILHNESEDADMED